MALSGCQGSDSSSDAATALAQLVLGAGPSGYRLSIDRALSLEDVAQATSSDPRALGRTLAQTGYDGGWSRTWTSGDAYLGIVAVQTGSEFGATELLQFQAAQLGAGQGVVAYPDEDVPGARAFDFFATTRQGGRQVFCQSVLFSVGADVIVLNDCNSAPVIADRVLATARAQYERAAIALGVPIASPSASAS